ncbi:MAG: hypothetical protein AAB268_11105 [Elusimicrobiota bacterium]
MNQIPRRFLPAFLTVALVSARAPAQLVSVARVTLTPSFGGAAVVVPGLIGGPAMTSLSLMPLGTLAPSVVPVPLVMTPDTAINVGPLADGHPLTGNQLPVAFEALWRAAASRLDGAALFDNSKAYKNAPVAPPDRSQAGPKGFIKNADGVWVGGRVADLSVWIGRLYDELSPRVDLSGVMDVMDDAYDEARVKLMSVERAASDRDITQTSVHLEGTRNWVDAILRGEGGRNIAVHTHRVYFHPAPGNPASEISEGIRRVDKYLEKATNDFKQKGTAERGMGIKFFQVELNFDTRGYKEIEAHLRGKEKEFSAVYGQRFIFRYITEPSMASAPLRAEYNRLVEKYGDQPKGVMNILDGVTFSRAVGLGHELNSHKIRLQKGLKITQAGRDFFGKKVLPDGRIIEEYKTEFDAVTEPVADSGKPPRDRDVMLWEDKSVRIWMPLNVVMEETFLYKLRIYRDNRAIIEESLGGAPLQVTFSVDVGGRNQDAAKLGRLVWDDPRQKDLMEYLKESAPALSEQYGFPISFVFVNSRPDEDPYLFDKEPADKGQWEVAQRRERKRGRPARR